MIARWFGQITENRIRRAIFLRVPVLIAAIDDYVQSNNLNPNPFWTATIETILKRVKVATEVLDTLH